MGFVGVCQTGWARLRSLEAGYGTDGIFQEELLALAAQEKELHDFRKNSLADFARGGVVGALYGTGRAEALEGRVEFGKEGGLALDEQSFVGAIGTQMGIFLVHVRVDFVAEGIVVLESGKRVHRAFDAASGVPCAGE